MARRWEEFSQELIHQGNEDVLLKLGVTKAEVAGNEVLK